MRAARVCTALTAGCLAALVLAPAALAAPGSTSGPAPAPARAAATSTGSTGSSTSSNTSGSTSTSTSASSTSAAGTAAGGPARAATVPGCSTDPHATHPVICLPADSGEDRVAYLPAGSAIEFGAQVVNGGTTAADAKIVITLPATLRVFADDPPVRIDDWYPLDSSDDDGTDLRCTQSADFRTVVCDPGTLAPGANILIGIPLYAADNAPDGQRATFGVSLQPSGTSAFDPSSVSATVQFLGASHLQTTLTPNRLTVVVGRTGRIVAAVHNLGPSAAVGTIGLAVIAPSPGGHSHFLITNSAIDVTDDPSVTATVLHRRALLAQQFLAAQRAARPTRSGSAHPSPVGFWPIGTIAAGATAHVPVVVQAVSIGTSELTFGALSATDPGNCNDDGTACDEIAIAHLAAVAAVANSRHQEPLAATGTRADAAWVQAAVLLLALGALLVMLGRPVRARHRR